MPKVKQKQAVIEGKGKKFVAGIKANGGNKNIPFIPKPTVVKPAVLPPDAPGLPVPKNAKATKAKKWCLKNTQVLRAVIDKWAGNGKSKMPLSSVEQGSFTVNRHKVMDVLKQNISSTWSAVTYESVALEVTDDIKRTRDWVTTRVTGWVLNAHLDDYTYPYPDSEVAIPHATPNSTDPQQYMTLEIDEEERKFKHVIRKNMCGELSVAYVAKKDIDTVLNDWKAKKGSFFKDRLGMGKDTTLGPGHMQDILDIYFPQAEGGKRIEPYVKVEETVPPKIIKIPLAAPGRPVRASDEFLSKSKTHDFITLVRIDTNSGELIPAAHLDQRNHWVVVTRVMHGGYRVELYNPFPNKRQAYTFAEFYASALGGSILSGWWVKRGKAHLEKPYRPPVFGVAANNPTSNTEDAEQYVFIEGGGIKPKTRLCGEFCTAFIIGSSMDNALANWEARQKTRPAGLWELTNMLDACGFNNKDGRRLFSIDTLLRYWRKVQPNLYAAAVGGDTNEGTGLLDLMSILRAYGYRKEDMSLSRPDAPEPLLFSPERDARQLKKYYLIAGVVIHGSTGRLKDKTGGGVEHWVVVNKIDTEGNQFGGGGGWVELYNPFPNSWEEYSLGEFTRAFNGGTLWLKREITPVFSPETPAPPKVKVKAGLEVKVKGKGGTVKGKGVAQALGITEIVKEFNSLMKQPKAVLGDIIRRLANRSGVSPAEIRKLVGAGKETGKPDVDVEKLLCEHLGVKSIPGVIVTWIHEKAGEDDIFARQLADSLVRTGILIVNNKICTMADLEKSDFSGAANLALAGALTDLIPEGQERQASLRPAGLQITVNAAGRAAKPFVSITVDELKATAAKIAEAQSKTLLIAREKPIHAYKPRDEYLEWIKKLEKADPGRLYRVRIWGDPVMSSLGFDVNDPHVAEDAVKGVGHFQAVGLYNNFNKDFGAISNHIDIKREDIDNLIQMQIEEEFSGKLITFKQKMNWLCAHRGNIFMYDDASDKWETAQQIRWGTIALGGNLVKIERFEEIETKLPGEKKKRVHRMGRLVGFRKSDWARPLDELLAEGLVHRCFCIYKNNGFGDVPNKGVVFSPLFSPKDWGFNGNKKLDALYIPEVYLELKGKK